jgi:hypothetical protein
MKKFRPSETLPRGSVEIQYQRQKPEAQPLARRGPTREQKLAAPVVGNILNCCFPQMQKQRLNYRRRERFPDQNEALHPALIGFQYYHLDRSRQRKFHEALRFRWAHRENS